MQQVSNIKHPILHSILCTIVILLFYTAGGAAAQITNQNNVGQLIVQGIAVWASVIAAFIYLRLRHRSPKELKFIAPSKEHFKRSYYFLPIIIIEISGFFVGLRELSYQYCLAALFLLIAVGFSEEIYFRGFVFNGLLGFGPKKAILISSLFFGCGHMANCIGGKDIVQTLLQVVWAFVFGIVFAELFLLADSIYPVIIIHFLHDLFGYIQCETVNNTTIILSACQTILLIIYSIMLWKKLFCSKDSTNMTTISA